MSWIGESSEARRQLPHQHQKEGLLGWVQVIGEANQRQMAMQVLEMETTTDIANKMAVGTHNTVAIATASLHHHRRKSVDEHGNDTEMTDQIQDCHPDLRKQIIQPMMDQGNAQMATDPGLVIWNVNGPPQEAELVHPPLTHISLATGQTAVDEMIAPPEMIDLQETIDLLESEMTVLEDAMTETSVGTRIETGTGTGWIMMSAAETHEPEVAVAAQSVIASGTE